MDISIIVASIISMYKHILIIAIFAVLISIYLSISIHQNYILNLVIFYPILLALLIFMQQNDSHPISQIILPTISIQILFEIYKHEHLNSNLFNHNLNSQSPLYLNLLYFDKVSINSYSLFVSHHLIF